MATIDEVLVGEKVVTEAQLAKARTFEKATGVSVGDILVLLGYAREADVVRARAVSQGKDFSPSVEGDVTDKDLGFWLKYGQRYGVLPVSGNGKVTVFSAGPVPTEVQYRIKNSYGGGWEVCYTPSEEIYSYVLPLTARHLQATLHSLIANAVKSLDEGGEKAIGWGFLLPKLLDSILGLGIALGASDIHFEQEEDIIVLRMRVDGLLREIALIPREIYLGASGGLVNSIIQKCQREVQSLNKPFDGRFVYTNAGVSVDVRVSVIPNFKGSPSTVMRLLGGVRRVFSLEGLGISPDQVELWDRFLVNFTGMVIISGPTGSGKTTTLYAAVRRVASPQVNIVTVEDPVEYLFRLVKQVQVSKELSFASALRSFLRHDPDVIIVGETRDQETAQIAFQAALTGHLVLTSFHANTTLGIVARLKGFGIEEGVIGECLKGLSSQRLVRVVCPYCAEEVEIPEIYRKMIPDELRSGLGSEKRGKGCPKCNYTGYRGRTVIAEILPVQEIGADLVLGLKGKEVEKRMKELGIVSMREHGFSKVRKGITTVEEVMRVL